MSERGGTARSRAAHRFAVRPGRSRRSDRARATQSPRSSALPEATWRPTLTGSSALLPWRGREWLRLPAVGRLGISRRVPRIKGSKPSSHLATSFGSSPRRIATTARKARRASPPRHRLGLPGRALEASQDQQRGRVPVRNGAAAAAGDKGRRVAHKAPLDGLQAPGHGAGPMAAARRCAPAPARAGRRPVPEWGAGRTPGEG
jgi:hypothetical protein